MGGIAVLILFGIALIVYYVPMNLWIKSIASGAGVGITSLIGMRLRRVDPALIVESYIQAKKGGLSQVRAQDLENHFIAGGNVQRIVQAMVSANRANITLSFEEACAIDLAGRDVYAAIKDSVSPRVIKSPPIIAVAKDGIQVKVITQVTVKVNLSKLVGGAGEATVLARVGQGVCTTIGSAEKHTDVLKNPQKITEMVLQEGLDIGTAFTIISIDIADVDVLDNIGSKLQIEAAEAEKLIAQAKAEEKKAFASAHVHEMQSLKQEMKAKLIEAEAEIPLAIAESFASGKYKLDN